MLPSSVKSHAQRERLARSQLRSPGIDMFIRAFWGTAFPGLPSIRASNCPPYATLSSAAARGFAAKLNAPLNMEEPPSFAVTKGERREVA